MGSVVQAVHVRSGCFGKKHVLKSLWKDWGGFLSNYQHKKLFSLEDPAFQRGPGPFCGSARQWHVSADVRHRMQLRSTVVKGSEIQWCSTLTELAIIMKRARQCTLRFWFFVIPCPKISGALQTNPWLRVLGLFILGFVIVDIVQF